MNKNLIITLVALGVLALFGFYFFNNNSQTNNQNTQVNENTTNNNVDEMTPSDDSMTTTESLDSLMSSGKNVMCTFSTDQNGMNINGVVYVAESKLNGDFDVQVGEMTMSSHMISDGTWMYTWTDGAPQGVKINLKAAQDKADMNPNDADSAAQQSNLDNLKQQYNFNCSPWTPDMATFELPADVTFMEL